MLARLSAAFLIAALLAPGRLSAAPSPRISYRFSAGSGLFARPGLGHDGALYVGSGDGYVHALSPQGAFRWSYTVKGRVLAPPVEEPESGRVFVVTSERRLYALEADSRLRWVFPLPVQPKTELVLTPRGTLFFVGQDDHLYGVTTGGALGIRIAAKAARSGPVTLAAGALALILGGELATLKGYGYERAPLRAVFSASAKLALGENAAIFACDERRARVVSAAGVEQAVESDCESAPEPGDGFFAVAEARAARLVFADGTDQRIPLRAAALRPRWDGPRRRLILATATGDVSVLELEQEAR